VIAYTPRATPGSETGALSVGKAGLRTSDPTRRIDASSITIVTTAHVTVPIRHREAPTGTARYAATIQPSVANDTTD
jgi:hypothetical protein